MGGKGPHGPVGAGERPGVPAGALGRDRAPSSAIRQGRPGECESVLPYADVLRRAACPTGSHRTPAAGLRRSWP